MTRTDQETTVQADDSTGWLLMGGARRPSDEFGKTHQRTVRLVISIPVLTLLIVLSSGAFTYFWLMNLAGQPTLSEVASTSLERAALTILLLSMVFSLISGGVGYILARQIVRPIKQLASQMEAIAGGDFSLMVEPIRLGEFGQLGTTFNRMVQQLNGLFQERDRQLRESFRGAHLVIDSAGVVLEADESSRRIFSTNPSDIVGKCLLEPGPAIPLIQRNPRLLEAIQELIGHALAGKAANRAVPVRPHDSNTPLRYIVSCLLLEGKEAAGARILMEIRDITGIFGFYEQMQRADRLAAVGTLATGIAHEIRNPLASIRGMTQLMAEGGFGAPNGVERRDNSTSLEYCRRIIREVDRLDKLISGIMNLASMDNAPPEEANLNDLLLDVEESARHSMDESVEKVKVEWDLDMALPTASLQVARLRQGLLNIILNAYQHVILTGRGPVRIQTIYLPVNPKRPINICIANPGDPIDEGTKERMFEPFYTTKPSGTGLGLPIAYQTILSNGGELELECDSGEIQFWIRLPSRAPSARASSRLLPKSWVKSSTARDDSRD